MLCLRILRKSHLAAPQKRHFVTASTWRLDGWLLRSHSTETPQCLEQLGITGAEWNGRCREWGIGTNPDLSGLEINLNGLERWGMTTRTRKMLVMKSVALSTQRFDSIQASLLWLQTQLDLEESEVVTVLHKFPRLLDLGLSDEHQRFLNRFLNNSHSMDNIKKMVLQYPMILGSLHKFGDLSRYFEGLGYSKAHVMLGVMQHPKLVTASVDDTIQPKINFFGNIGLSSAQVLSVLTRHPQTFCKLLTEDVGPQFRKFLDLGLTTANVNKIIRGCPSLLFRNFEELVQDKIDWLESHLLFRRETALKALVRHPRIFPSTLDTWKDTCQFFTNSGMSSTELTHCMKRCPKLLGRKSEGLREKFEFARTVLKKEPLVILRQVRYFTYSFEDRILFRAALSEKFGKDITKPSFRDLMDPSDADFCERFGQSDVQAFRKKWAGFTKEEKMDTFNFKIYD